VGRDVEALPIDIHIFAELAQKWEERGEGGEGDR